MATYRVALSGRSLGHHPPPSPRTFPRPNSPQVEKLCGESLIAEIWGLTWDRGVWGDPGVLHDLIETEKHLCTISINGDRELGLLLQQGERGVLPRRLMKLIQPIVPTFPWGLKN